MGDDYLVSGGLSLAKGQEKERVVQYLVLFLLFLHSAGASGMPPVW